MKTYKTQNRSADWACQSRVVHSGRRLTGRLNRWSVQIMRSRSRYGAGADRRGWTLFVSAGRLRGEIGVAWEFRGVTPGGMARLWAIGGDASLTWPLHELRS